MTTRTVDDIALEIFINKAGKAKMFTYQEGVDGKCIPGEHELHYVSNLARESYILAKIFLEEKFSSLK